MQVDNQLTAREVADELGCCPTLVRLRAREYRNANSLIREEFTYKFTPEKLQSFVERGLNAHQVAAEMNCSISLAQLRMREYRKMICL